MQCWLAWDLIIPHAVFNLEACSMRMCIGTYSQLPSPNNEYQTISAGELNARLGCNASKRSWGHMVGLCGLRVWCAQWPWEIMKISKPQRPPKIRPLTHMHRYNQARDAAKVSKNRITRFLNIDLTVLLPKQEKYKSKKYCAASPSRISISERSR